eukprot:scaffold55517_cov30-Tisochrysis_lutea.AAC.1
MARTNKNNDGDTKDKHGGLVPLEETTGRHLSKAYASQAMNHMLVSACAIDGWMKPDLIFMANDQMIT